MPETTSAHTVVRGELPPPERAEALAMAEPEDSPRDHALDQVGAVFASGLEE